MYLFLVLPDGRKTPPHGKVFILLLTRQKSNPIFVCRPFFLLATALIRSWIIYYSLSVRWRWTSHDYRPLRSVRILRGRGHCPRPSSCSGFGSLFNGQIETVRMMKEKCLGEERERGREEKSANAQRIHVKSRKKCSMKRSLSCSA